MPPPGRNRLKTIKTGRQHTQPGPSCSANLLLERLWRKAMVK